MKKHNSGDSSKREFLEQVSSSKPETLTEKNKKYNGLLLSAVKKIEVLDEATIKRSSYFWVDDSRSRSIKALKEKMIAIGRENKSPAEKVWDIALSVAKTYNAIAKLSNKSTTAKALLEVLRDLSKNHNIQLIFRESDHKLKPVTLIQGDSMIADEFIFKKFAAKNPVPYLPPRK